jgi:hypothetical protein
VMAEVDGSAFTVMVPEAVFVPPVQPPVIVTV